MSALLALKSTTSFAQLAVLLGYKPHKLSYILYKKPASAKYSSFTIPKKSGGVRQIDAPADDLKLVQKRLSKLLQDCAEEIREVRGMHDDGPNPDQISHGFRRNRSIGTNADQHLHRRHVFNLDLEGFFPACNFGRVRGILIKDKNYALNPDVAQVIAHIACFNGTLPQGSPTSPCISNIIAHVLDIHLTRLAHKNGCHYSRYADDLTFSTNLKVVPRSIAGQDSINPHIWLPGAELERLIVKSGFTINAAKTRLQYRDSRQEVTGLVVNQRVNVRREYRHLVRSMVHRVLRTGSFEHKIVSKDATGKLIESTSPGTLDELQGMLGFIDAIDRKYGPLEEDKPKKKKSPKDLEDEEEKEKKKKIKKKKNEKKLSAYAHFLLFKNFYAAESPVIVAEGKTDNIYLTHAMRRLAPAHPRLATMNPDGSVKLLVRLFKYAGRNTGKTIGLIGGYADLCKFVSTYASAVESYKAPGKTQPVIVLVDNDSGGNNVIQAAAKVSKKTITGAEPFVHVTGNLYLAWTPLIGTATTSCIEDGFDMATQQIPVDGKKFNSSAETDTDTEFGKVVFAYKVVEAQADKIDFSGFSPLLTRLSQAIEHHAAALAAAKIRS